MNKQTLYVELIPGWWPAWAAAPMNVRLGRVRKRAPKPEERHRFAVVEFEPDLNSFTPKVFKCEQ